MTRRVDVYFGKSGSRGQMARVAGKDGVYVARGYSSYLYTREVKNWRETSILKFEDANAIQVEVDQQERPRSASRRTGTSGSGSFTQARQGAASSASPEKEWKKFDEAQGQGTCSAPTRA